MNQYPLIKGKTDLKTRFPEVAAQWDDEKNEGTGPEDVQPASMKKVWWRCPKGHSWRAAVYARTAGNGCPYCAGNTLDRGVNDLLTVAPEIAGQWDAEKNGILGPQDVTAGNRRKAWWICPRGHSWEASVASRVSGKGCPYCAGRKVMPGFNDLATTNPKVAAEWSGRNLPLLPTMVMANANRKAWWKCEKGHEWNTLIPTKTGGSRCPFCSNIRILKGFNDFATTNPELAMEWSDRNSKKPDEINALSRDKVWWKCSECGHEWRAVVDTRVRGSGCPVCSKRQNEIKRQKHLQEKEIRTIFEENYPRNVLLYYLTENGIEVKMDNDGLIGIPIAFYFPQMNAAVEITGYGDRQTKQAHRYAIVENDLCRKLKINLIRILPRGAKGYDDCICIKQNGNHKKAFGEALGRVFKKLETQVDIDVIRDAEKIYQYYLSGNDVAACGQVDHK